MFRIFTVTASNYMTFSIKECQLKIMNVGRSDSSVYYKYVSITPRFLFHNVGPGKVQLRSTFSQF